MKIDFSQHVSASLPSEELKSQTANHSSSALLNKRQAAVHSRISSLLARQIPPQPLFNLVPQNPFVIEAKKVDQITLLSGISRYKLLEQLITFAKPLARPPISNYHVGAVGLGKSGNVYLGVNIEFKGFPLNQAIHGEQFLVANARNHGETELVAIATSAAPCGHCRQFLNEIGNDHIEILIPNCPPKKLSTLLPESFGPQDLGVLGGLLTATQVSKLSKHACPVTAQAIDAANASYAPYSQAIAGVAIKATDGKIYSGSYLENAAFNPSLSPFHVALVAFVADMREYSDICEVVLAEKADGHVSQAGLIKQLVKGIAPQATFKIELLR